jgi:hypothetical protein
VSETPAQRFNHVAFTVEPELLGENVRSEIASFYRAVFGWREVERMTVDRSRFVLQCHLPDQFVYIVGGTPITACAEQDHFGLAVGSRRELEDIVQRALERRDADDRVEVVGPGIEEHGEVRVHYAYVRYLLPMSVEIQYFEVRE